MKYCGQCRYYQRINRYDGRCKLYSKIVWKGRYACEVWTRKEGQNHSHSMRCRYQRGEATMICPLCNSPMKSKSVHKPISPRRRKHVVRHYCGSSFCPVIFIETSGRSKDIIHDDIIHIAIDSRFSIPQMRLEAERRCYFCGEVINDEVWSLDEKQCCYECGIERSG